MAEPSETIREAGVRAVVYHDGRYDASPERIADELGACDAVVLEAVRSLGEGADESEGLPVVFTDTAPSALSANERPDLPAVWVSASGRVVREALAGDAIDAVLWRPEDGWATLAAKLEAIAARPETRLKRPTEPFDSTTATQVDAASPSVDAEDTALYEYLVRTVGDAVYVLDEEGRFTFVNDALCDLTGYDREELLGSSVHIIKDDETVAEAEEALRDLLRESGTADAFDVAKLDVELITRDGEHVPCTDRMTLRPSDEDGNLTGTVGTLRDVSRQQRREDILGGMLEATQEMVGASTTDEVAQLVTETAVEVLDIDLVTLREHDPETDTLRPISVSDAAAERLPDRPVYDADEGLVGEAFSRGELLVSTDLDDDVRDPGDLETAAYVPLGDRRILSVGRPGEGGFDDDELRFLELLAATAGSVFERVDRGEQLRRYEAVVETAEEMLFTTDADGRFALVTAPLAEYLGHDRDSLAGLPAAEVFPDDAVVDDIVRDPSASGYETTMRARGGDLLPSRVTVTPIDDGTDSGVVGTVRDISELRSAKREASRQRRRFRELFDTLTDPVADVEYEDDRAVVRSVNPSFASLCECREEAVRDRPLASVRESLPDALSAVLADVETPDTSLERSVEVRTEDGRRYFLLRTVPYEGDDGKRAFLIFTDVTELERRGTHLSVLQRLLRHNLRTETTVIQGYAESLVDSEEPSVRDAGERIREASRSLVETSETAHTIQQVLRAEDDDREVVAARDLRSSLSETLSTRFPDDDVAVVGDPHGDVRVGENLLTAVEELVDNAVTHAGPDPAVTVRLEATDDELRIAVGDDGPGIPDAEWDVVAGDREITQLQHTSGLGLWLVKWIADRHGGRLLRTDGGEGAGVVVCLPRA